MNLAILVLAHLAALAVLCWVTHAGPATAVGVALTGGFSVLAYLLGRSDAAEAAEAAPRARPGRDSPSAVSPPPGRRSAPQPPRRAPPAAS
jgi:hypothetical protein